MPSRSPNEAAPEPATVVTSPDEEIFRTRWPPNSPTYKLEVTVSNDMPKGLLNLAAVPCPSSHPPVALPASVVTFQTHAGCALSPLTVHAVAGEHGAQAEAPLAKVPIGQVDAVKAHDVAPSVLKDPAEHG